MLPRGVRRDARLGGAGPEAAQAARRPAADAAALALAALAASPQRRVAGGEGTVRRGRGGLIDRLSDEELARRLDALVHLATAEMYLDRFEASGRHAERALAIGRATGQGDLFPLLFPMLGTSLWVQGRVVEAAEVFDGAIEGARLLDNAQGFAWNLFNRSFAALARRRRRPGARDGEESIELARELDAA